VRAILRKLAFGLIAAAVMSVGAGVLVVSAAFALYALLRGPLGPAKLLLSADVENLGHGLALPSLDAVIQILKDPAQPLPQGTAYAALSGAHKSHQKYGRKTGSRCLRLVAGHTRAWRHFCRLSRTLFRTIQFSFRCYFSARFLRWILPLKVRSTTDDAALPIVPTKALPCLIGAQEIWDRG